MIAMCADAQLPTACTNPTRRRLPLRRGVYIFAAWALALLCLGPAGPTLAQAQLQPKKPIRITVGSAAGGSLDVQARIIGQALPKVLGQSIVIENRPGGNGIIGGQLVANATRDGSRLFAYGGDLFSLGALMPRSDFDAGNQLVAVSQISESPLLVVTGGRSPFNDVKGMIEAANAGPQGLTYATFAFASVNNVVGQWIAKEAHIKLHNVTYRSGAEAALAAAAGDVSLAIVSPASVFPSLVGAGAVKVIALTTEQRPSYLPASWSTLAESGLPIDASTFFGIFGAAGMPDAAITRLDRAFNTVLSDDAVRQRLRQVGMFAEHLGPAELAKRIKADRRRYERIIEEMHMVDALR